MPPVFLIMMYELLTILPAQYTEAELPAMRAKISALVTDAGATIVREDDAGKIKLSYPIKQSRYGHFTVVYFESEPGFLPKINNSLRLSSEIARFQILSVKKEAKEPVKVMSYEDARGRGRETREDRQKATAAAVAVAGTHIQEAAVPGAPAISMEDLDKKLDEILNEKVS